MYGRRYSSDGSPKGAAFLVNAGDTAGDQHSPAVAADGAGDFVVVWVSDGRDGDAGGVYARRYGADGAPLGGAFAVNTVAAGDQSRPTVAADAAGAFVVAWQSSGQDGDGYGVYARRYDAAGAALDPAEFRVNAETAGDQLAPTAAVARDTGRFVIAWEGEVLPAEVGTEPDFNVFARLFAADGTTVRDEFTVNSIVERSQVGPDVGMDAAGNFVVAWTSEGQTGSGSDVYARRFDADGTGLGSDFRVNETLPRGQQDPSVAVDGDGDFLVTWQSSHQDGFSWGIFARAYDATGSAIGGEFQVNTNTQGPQIAPSVDSTPDGSAVVVWLGLDAGHNPAVHAQRYRLPAGSAGFSAAPEGEVVLANYSALEEAPSAAAVDADGNYVVVWQSYGEDGSGLGVFGRRLDCLGRPIGEPFRVAETVEGNQSNPDVAMALDGTFVVVWQSRSAAGDGYDVFARRYDAAGAPLGGEFLVNTTLAGDQDSPAVAIDGDGGTFVVVWQGPDGSGTGIYAQRFDADGTPVGSERRLNAFTDLDQVSPAVAMNAAGQYVVTWVSDHRAVFDPDDTEKSVFVQWFDADGVSRGDEVLVHAIDPDSDAQELPDVAMNADGSFVVVWQSINQDGNSWGVFGRQFRADKTPAGNEFQVNQTVLAPQRHASVVSDASGNFVVSWESHAQDASGPGVFARVFDAAGAAETDEFLVATWDEGPQTWPVMAMTADGRLGTFWTGHGQDRVEGVHGRVSRIDDLALPRVYVVNSLDDGPPVADCRLTLREALLAANADASVGDAPAGRADGDTIRFADGLLGTITLTQGELAITDDLTIDGGGAITISGNGASRIFNVAAAGGSGTTRAVVLERITLTAGAATGDGGAVLIGNGGDVTLNAVTVTGGTAAGRGGGVYSGTGMLNIADSLFYDNSAAAGGGLASAGGTVTVVNSTFSADSAAGSGGGILVAGGTVSLDSVTVTLSQAGAGGGVAVVGGTFSAKNSIIAGNTISGGTASSDVSGAVISGGHNLFGSTAGATITGRTNGDRRNVDPKLGALADNGGPTMTHALLAGSPAVEAGDTALTTDQRGQARPQGAADDIGAFESAFTRTVTSPAALVVGTGDGRVLLLNADGSLLTSFRPYGVFPGEVHVALADLNGDDVLDIITGAGEGGGPHVRAFDGSDPTFRTVFADFFAYAPVFKGGVYVAGGFVNGVYAIVTGAGRGGGPHVKAFDVSDPAGGTVIASFYAFGAGFTGGVRVAVGDVDQDGDDDVAVAAGPGGGPHVKVFDGADLASQTLLASFFAYDAAFTGGVFVSVGHSAGRPVLVTGAGAGGGPHVKVFGAGTLGAPTVLSSFFAYDAAFDGGVTVGLLDVDGDGDDEIVTAAGPGGGPHVKAFDGSDLGDEDEADLIASFFAVEANYREGLFAPV